MSNLNDLLALVNKKRAEIKAKSTFTNVAKIPSGKSRWRILPGWNPLNRNMFFHDFAQHYIKDADGNVLVVYLCDQHTYQNECEHCQMISAALRGTKDDAILKVLKEFNARGQFLVNALRMDGENKDENKAVLLALPSSVMDMYLALLAERHEDGIEILDENEGRDTTITREGAGLNTKYKLNDAAKNTAINSGVMESLVNIDEFLAGERQKGVSKGVAIGKNAVAALLGRAPITIAASTSTASAGTGALVPQRRMIEVDPTAETSAVVATAPPTTASVASVASNSISDAELESLLGDLDKIPGS